MDKNEWLQKMIDEATVREAASIELQSGINELIEGAVAAERERCAKIAHNHAAYRGSASPGYDYNTGYQRAAIDIEAAIGKGEM